MANSPQSFQLHTRAFYDRMRREFYSSNNEPIHAEIFHAMNRLVGAKARKYFPPERNFCCYSDAVADVMGKFFTVTIHDYLSDKFAESHPTDNLRLAYLHCAVRNALIDIYRAERARGNVSHAEPEDNSAPRRIMNVSLNKALPNGGELGDHEGDDDLEGLELGELAFAHGADDENGVEKEDVGANEDGDHGSSSQRITG